MAEPRGTESGAGGVMKAVGASATGALQGGVVRSALSFEELYVEHYAGALRVASGLVGDPGDAADLVQEAFVRIFSRVRPVRDPDAFQAYVRRTVVRVAVSRWRSETRDLRRRERYWLLNRPPDDSPATADVQLLRALSRLPMRQRTVVVLRYWMDWTEADIAAAIGSRPGTVKSLSARALATLRAELTNG